VSREPRKPGKGGRKVRIDLRKNREKTARDKPGLTRRLKAGDETVADHAQHESVRAKGELSRKRTIIIEEEGADRGDLRTGIVVAVRGLICEVDDGVRRWGCTVRRMLRTHLIRDRVPITVGDRVRFSPVYHGTEVGQVVVEGETFAEGVIEDVEERETTLLRQYERKIQVIAANVDTAVITVSVSQPALRPHLIDRYLVSVHKGDLRPIICINKADLDETGEAEHVRQRYHAIGYQAVLTSATNGRGVDFLRGLIRDRMSVFVGPSGAGKSSLINVLAPGMNLMIGTVSDMKKGRHTTTTARLLAWPFGGYVVDTPGMRQFELPDVEAVELEAYFAEFIDLVRDCRFPGCSHTHETECAVKAAVEEGRISRERYESYCKMYEECAAKPRY
jgi:ribosome biogenesis GTPase